MTRVPQTQALARQKTATEQTSLVRGELGAMSCTLVVPQTQTQALARQMTATEQTPLVRGELGAMSCTLVVPQTLALARQKTATEQRGELGLCVGRGP
jgi:hypothetical protein